VPNLHREGGPWQHRNNLAPCAVPDRGVLLLPVQPVSDRQSRKDRFAGSHRAQKGVAPWCGGPEQQPVEQLPLQLGRNLTFPPEAAAADREVEVSSPVRINHVAVVPIHNPPANRQRELRISSAHAVYLAREATAKWSAQLFVAKLESRICAKISSTCGKETEGFGAISGHVDWLL
jgi:hypothetical protein